MSNISNAKKISYKMLMNYLMSFSEIPVKPAEEILYGAETLYTDKQIAFLYGIYVYPDSTAIDDTEGHGLVKLLMIAKRAIAKVRDNDFTVSGTTAKEEIGLMNLGRLAKLVLAGDDRVKHIENIYNELSKNIAGAAAVGTTPTLYNAFLDMWPVIGQNLKSMIGGTITTHPRPADDITAGAWLCLFYVLFCWTGHLMSLMYLWKRLGVFSIIDGITRGSFVNLQRTLEETWGSALAASENLELSYAVGGSAEWGSTGHAIFGLDPTQIDSTVIRALRVSLYTHAVSFWQNWLSKTRWTWRFGRWIEVQPLYFIFSPESAPGDDGAVYGDWDAAFSMDNITSSHQWRWLNQTINETVQEFREMYFKNDAFGTLKKFLNTVPFSSIPMIGSAGNGGLLFHQFSHWVDGGAGTDKFYNKLFLDDDNAGHQVLMTRRDTLTNLRFSVIGDCSLRDYQLMTAFVSGYTKKDGDSTRTQIEGNNSVCTLPFMDVKSLFGFCVTKSEERPYSLDVHIMDTVAPATKTCPLDGTVIIPRTWRKQTTSSDTYKWPVSLGGTKGNFFYQKCNDPYKKLKHVAYDINELDVDKISSVFCSILYPSGAPESTTATVITSALPLATGVPADKSILTSPEVPKDNQTIVSAIPKVEKDKKEEKK